MKTKNGCHDLIKLGLVLFAVVNVSVGRQNQPVKVCDVLSTPERFDNKLVVIRGLVAVSADNSQFDEIAAPGNESCPESVRSERIGIAQPDVHFLSNPPEGWKLDEESFARAANTLTVLFEQNPSIRIVEVTAEGMVFSGGARPGGVTRHQWHPAAFVIASIKDLRAP